MKKTLLAASAALAMALGGSAAIAANIADVVVIIDESGSMGGEQAWISGMISSLDSALQAEGIGDGTDGLNNFALVGFGSSSASVDYLGVGIDDSGRGNNTWMSSTDFGTATGNLLLNGSIEDGYAGIDYFFDNYTVRSGAALNVILVTDENRDVRTTNTYASILAQLTGADALLNVVVDALFEDLNTGDRLLGIDSESPSNGYVADGSGGYTTTSPGGAISGDGGTIAEYVDLALATGGAAWDLNLLRAGGLTADSFTAAFVDIKVGEIQEQVQEGEVPAPAAILLMGIGLLGMRAFSRKA